MRQGDGKFTWKRLSWGNDARPAGVTQFGECRAAAIYTKSVRGLTSCSQSCYMGKSSIPTIITSCSQQSRNDPHSLLHGYFEDSNGHHQDAQPKPVGPRLQIVKSSSRVAAHTPSDYLLGPALEPRKSLSASEKEFAYPIATTSLMPVRLISLRRVDARSNIY